MANFGIAEELVVVTESAVTGERWRCVANRCHAVSNRGLHRICPLAKTQPALPERQ